MKKPHKLFAFLLLASSAWCQAPVITSNPISVTVTSPAGASFSVTATGNPSPTFQWQRYTSADSTWRNISGATTSSYSLASTASTDNGSQFRVIATNALGSATSNSAILTVYYPPVIISQPNSVSVTSPATATFTVVANGNPATTYQWQRFGGAWNNISGATSTSYITPTTTSSDNGAQFRVVATNAAGSVTSNVATLTVFSTSGNPAITSNPQPITVTAPQPASFSVTATGTPAPSYQWQRLIDSTWINIIGEASPNYTLASTTPADNNARFRCIATNSQGSAVSAAAVLTVLNPLLITSHPANLTVAAGDSARFTVYVTGNPSPAYQWQRIVGSIWNNISGATFPSYSLAPTTLDNGAQFRCVVNNSVDTVVSNSAVLTVTSVSGNPVITSHPNSSSVTAPAPAIFTVVANGSPSVTYQWQRYLANVWTNIAGATDSTYALSPTAPSDNGAQFRAIITNAIGSAISSAATLSVNTSLSSPAFTLNPQSVTVTAPAGASFSVSATGNPTPSYQWQRLNGAWTNIPGATGNSYSLTSTNLSDNAAAFRCIATNSQGSATSSIAYLTVVPNGLPVITVQPISQTVTAPASASFSVTARDSVPLSYQWRRNGVDITGATASTYTLSPTAFTDNGASFSVVVTNSVGSVFSAGAGLTVQYKPRISSHPASIAVTSPNSASFSVVASGNPSSLTYQWQRNNANIPGATGPSYTLSPTAPGDNNAQFRVIVTNTVGADSSAQAYLLVDAALAPPIVSDPSPVTVTAPQAAAAFSVSATGNPTPTYQWQRNGANITGATGSSYALASTSAADNGALFRVIATNSLGADTSASAVLTVYYPPVISTQPFNSTVIAPATATFTVALSSAGNPASTYQWQRNSINIPGATLASYTTPATTLADNGAQFRCAVANSTGSVTSSSATLTVQYAPIITSQPNSSSVTAPAPAIFTVVANGSPSSLTYQWQRTGVDIVGASGSSYTLNPTASSDNGAQFRCVVTNSVGSITSSAATLSVNGALSPPIFTSSPQSDTVVVPGPASFSATATGNPNPTFQWQRFVAGTWTIIVSAVNNSYTLTQTSPSDSGAMFRCIASNSQGIAVSAVATLTVISASGNPAITSQPTNITVMAPATAIFSVAATGNPSPTYQWQRNGVNIPGATSASYTTGATSPPDNNAQFRVVVSNSAGAVFSNSATLTVQYRPIITSQPNSVAVTAPNPATFTVVGNGNPSALTYQWRRNGLDIPGAISSSYTLFPTSTTDNGAQFQCMVTNSVGSDTSLAAMLSINSTLSPPNFTSDPQSVTVTVPAGASFSVTATGNPNPAFQWQRNGVNIAGATSNAYSLASTTLSDHGAVFRCIAVNSQGGDTSTTAVLTVTTASGNPAITAHPVDLTATEGVSASFSISAIGTPVLNYQWQRLQGGNWTSILVARANTYTLYPISADSGAEFRCIVFNTSGSDTSNAATLHVTTASRPFILTQPTDQTSTVGTAATFSVSAVGASPLTYQWQWNQANSWSSIPGTNAATYSLNPALSDSGAMFRCLISNSLGTDTSNAVTLHVNAGGIPILPRLRSDNSLVFFLPGSPSLQFHLPYNAKKVRLWMRDVSGTTRWTNTFSLGGETSSLTLDGTRNVGGISAGIYLFQVQALDNSGRPMFDGVKRVFLPAGAF